MPSYVPDQPLPGRGPYASAGLAERRRGQQQALQDLPVEVVKRCRRLPEVLQLLKLMVVLVLFNKDNNEIKTKKLLVPAAF